MKRRLLLSLLALSLVLPAAAQSVLIDGARLSTIADDAAADTTVTFDVNLPPGGTGGVVYFTFSAAGYAGATVTVDAGPDTAQLVNVLAATTLANVNTTQRFRVDSFAAAVLRITYTTGGATAVTYDLAFGYGGGSTVAVTQPVQVEGPDADGSPAIRPPVLVAGSDGTNISTILTDSTGRLVTHISFTPTDNSANILSRPRSSAAGSQMLASGRFDFNGLTWDLGRNNEEITVLASAARTATTPSATLTNFNGSGAIIFVNVTSITASPTITVNVQMRDPVSGTFKTIWTAPQTITATGETVYALMPGVQAPRSGPGRVRSITGTDPAAGAAMIETVPAGVIWRFISMNVTLVTDSNVASRSVHFIFDDGTNPYLRVTNDQGQAENLTQIYSVANSIHMGFANPNIQSFPSPTDLFLPAGHRIREGTNNFQAGDDFGAPQLLVEEWQVPANGEAAYFNVAVPRQWRVSVTHADTDSITYSIGTSYIN